MSSARIPFFPAIRPGLTWPLLALALALSLVACGGGGAVVTGVAAPRALSTEMTARNAVAYSPYRAALTEPGRNDEVISEAMIKEDLQLLVAGNFRLIRLFDSSDKVARQTLKVIRDNNLDMKVMLGVWIAAGTSPEIQAANQAEIARAVTLATQYSDLVLALSVGNETMVSWSFNKLTPSQMAGYIRTVRSQVTQPVTTDDNWAFFAQASSNEQNPRAVIDTIDFVAMHTYPLAETIHPPATWDWQQFGVSAGPARAQAMMDAAVAAAKSQYNAVRSKLDAIGFATMPVIVGETGWKAVASDSEYNRAHPVNQKMYFDRLVDWQALARMGEAGPSAIFYFQAFDEQWKGKDDKWGLFNKNRQARYVVQDRYPVASGYLHEPGAYTSADAVYAPDVSDVVAAGKRFTVYADIVPAGADAAVASGSDWFGWDSPPTAFAGEEDPVGTPVTGAPGDAAKAAVVKPVPKSWGWGVLVAPGNGTVTADLTAFEASGTLNFSIKTDYPGKLEVGFLTGSGQSAYDVYLPLSRGQYGFAADCSAWCSVSIPIKDIKAFGAPAFGNQGQASAVFNLAKVTNPFVLADRYANTGKPQNSGFTQKIYVDNIYWAR